MHYYLDQEGVVAMPMLMMEEESSSQKSSRRGQKVNEQALFSTTKHHSVSMALINARLKYKKTQKPSMIIPELGSQLKRKENGEETKANEKQRKQF